MAGISAEFGPVVTAMITPFEESGAVNYDEAARLARFLENNGSTGLVLAGTTGEAPTLTFDEEDELARAVGEAVNIPLLLGTGSNDTLVAAERTAHVSHEGLANGILAVSPYYNRPSQQGLEGYFRTVAEATDLPVIMYDIPVRTGRKVATSTLITLAHGVSNIMGLKDAAGDIAETMQVLRGSAQDFEVYSGDDALNFPLAAVGAVGAISVASHWAGRPIAALFDAVSRGQLDRARQINNILIDSYGFETSEQTPNPLPTREMMRQLGFSVGLGRAPMDDAPTYSLANGAEEVRARLNVNIATLLGEYYQLQYPVV